MELNIIMLKNIMLFGFDNDDCADEKHAHILKKKKKKKKKKTLHFRLSACLLSFSLSPISVSVSLCLSLSLFLVVFYLGGPIYYPFLNDKHTQIRHWVFCF